MATRLKVVAEPAASDLARPPAIEFEPAPTRKRNAGWTAERQRIFIDHLALTGLAGLAAARAGISSRSANRLRNKAGAESFARAWDAALTLAATRLSTIVFDRAVNGRVERVYRDGELVMERRIPSDYLLTWLLSRLDPVQFGPPPQKRTRSRPATRATLRVTPCRSSPPSSPTSHPKTVLARRPTISTTASARWRWKTRSAPRPATDLARARV